jgi:tetratricopeptide (TPR) repeat protein
LTWAPAPRTRGVPTGLVGLVTAFLAALLPGCGHSPALVTKRVDGRIVVSRAVAPQAYEHVARALLFEQSDRLEEAADELARALNFDDEAPEVLAHLAELDVELGRLDEAKDALARAERVGPTVEGALAAAALAEARHDDAGLANALAQAVVRADEDGTASHLEEAHLAQATERLGSLDAAGALATLEALVARLPQSARGRRQLAAVAWAMQQLPEAEGQLRSLLEDDPNDLDAQLLLASLLSASDRPVDAKAAFEEALSRSEEAVEIAEVYLKWLVDRGELEEARRRADALVASDPTTDESAERTSRLERAVKRPDRARSAAAYARAHGAGAAAMSFLIAEAEADAGHNREAAELLQQIPADAPIAFQARLRAADILAHEGDAATAEQALAKAAALLNAEPASPGRKKEAPSEATDGAPRSEASAEARVALALARSQVAEDAGHPDTAKVVLETALRRDADNPRLALALAAVEERQGRWEKALALGERVLARDKRSVEALNFCGYVAADHHHDLPQAIARLVAAAALDPGNGAILDSLGWAALAAGDLGKAAPFLRQAARLNPADPEILSHVAALEARLGSRPRALEAVRRALGLAPEPRVRRDLEAQLRELEGAERRPTTRVPR